MNTNRLALAAICLAFITACAQAEDWSQFRGNAGIGHSSAANLPTNWSAEDNVAWSTETPGAGWSSPVIADNQIWVTSATFEEATEEQKKARLEKNTGNQPLAVVNNLRMFADCFDRSTGKMTHHIELMSVAEPDWVHSMNSYASPTPVLSNGRLFCHFGTFGTACVDTKTGKVVWTNQSIHVAHENGPGSSPVVFADKLIFHCDGSDEQFIVALSTDSGEVAWKTPRSGKMNENPQLKKAYGTPLMVTDLGRPLLLSPASDWLYCYDPETGKELWKLSYEVLGFSIVSRPVYADGMLFMSTSFMRAELLAIDLGGGDKPKIVWRANKQIPSIGSPLVVDDLIYFVSDKGGVLSCLDSKLGDLVWQERLGGNYCASPTYADGKIFFFDRDGKATIIKPGRTFEKIAENMLPTGFMATPAMVDDSIIARTEEKLYRIKK